ncbi:MAG: AraC family transcriptional regulator [Clostridiales bacterium]|nr:AraC family transcriptional regulator [Clostridiales bacterium]
MRKVNNIQYMYDKNANIELIVCNNSVISYPLHNHVSVLTIGLVLCGSILLTIGDNSSICEKSNSFTIPPYVPHIIKAQNPYSLLTLCINKNVIKEYSKDKIKNNIFHLLSSIPEPKLTDIQILQLLNCLDSCDSILFPDSAEPFIDLAQKQIERYPEMKLSIDEMAHSLYISKYHFIRSFKQAVGLTPHQFLIQNRVRKAQHMLSKIDNITEVALNTGFCDQSHFIKSFEKYVGLTPTAYKTSYKALT